MTILLTFLLALTAGLALNLSRKLYVERERHEAEIADALAEAERFRAAWQSAWSRAADLTGENRRLATALADEQAVSAHWHGRVMALRDHLDAARPTTTSGGPVEGDAGADDPTLESVEAVR